jgi:hypothetical protein
MSLQENAVMILRLGHDRLLSNPFQFIIRPSSHQSRIVCNTDRAVKVTKKTAFTTKSLSLNSAQTKANAKASANTNAIYLADGRKCSDTPESGQVARASRLRDQVELSGGQIAHVGLFAQELREQP